MAYLDPGERPAVVYHGTDAASAESIRQLGLNEIAWRQAANAGGVDDKGFSVKIIQQVAVDWAACRALQHCGPPEGVVLEADGTLFPLCAGEPGEWTDFGEYYIRPQDFSRVMPGTFH